MPAQVAAPASQNPRPYQRILSAVLSVRAVVGAVLTIACYFIGATYYSNYLGYFHLDNELFPRDTARHFVMGGMATFQFCVGAIESIKNNPLQALAWALGIVAYFSCLAWFLKDDQNDPPLSERWRKLLLRLVAQWKTNHWLRMVIKLTVYSVLGLYVAFVSLLAVLFTIGLPAFVGEYAAKVSYERAVKAYAGGCKASGRDTCFRLEQDGKPPVEGFIVASSADQVALYNNGSISVLPLKGNRLISVGPGTKP